MLMLILPPHWRMPRRRLPARPSWLLLDAAFWLLSSRLPPPKQEQEQQEEEEQGWRVWRLEEKQRLGLGRQDSRWE